MILTGLIIAAGFLAVTFWDNLRVWLVKALQEARKLIKGALIGSKVFLQRLGKAYKEVAKMYSQDEKQQWHLTTTTRVVSENEIPEEIRRKAASSNEVDITKQFEKELSLYRISQTLQVSLLIHI